jgi:large subunit ribosomal protein L21
MTSDAYAIIETGGKQFKVRRDRRVRVPSLAGDVGERVTFDRVLYVYDGRDGAVGVPTVEGAAVTGEIVAHGRGKKVVVFTFRKRHRTRKKRGHRQDYTEVAIVDLGLGETGGERRAARAAGSAGRRPSTEVETEAEEVGGDLPEGRGRQTSPYVCEECGRGFATERGLQQHRAKAHVD